MAFQQQQQQLSSTSGTTTMLLEEQATSNTTTITSTATSSEQQPISNTSLEIISSGAAAGTLYLEGRSLNATERRLQWDEQVIDNEYLNRKSSKICCIFKKTRNFDESSTEEESSSSEDSGSSDSSCSCNPYHPHHKNHQDEDPISGKHKKPKRKIKPNAYERQPNYMKNKSTSQYGHHHHCQH